MYKERHTLLNQYATMNKEDFTRNALAFLEREYRLLCLSVLGELTSSGLAIKSMYPEIGSLQRPSWGSWNGFLLGALKARRSILSSGSATDREALTNASLLAWLSGCLEQLVPFDDLLFYEHLRITTGFSTGSNTKGIRIRDLFSLQIQLRNRTAHDNITDPDWWEAAAYVLNKLVDWHTSSELGTRLEITPASEPWLFEQDGELWCYNGIEIKGANSFAVYVSTTGRSKLDQHRASAVMLAFQRLLGDEKLQEANFKNLLRMLTPEELTGFILGNYLVGEKAGEGGWAEVYRGTQLSTGRRVAIKILKSGLSELDRARFLQEAEYLSRFDHPNIVKVYEHDEQPWHASKLYNLSEAQWFKEFKQTHGSILTFLAIEWIDGKTLDDVYHEMKVSTRPYSEREIAGWFAATAEALEVIHNTNLIHRDISPRNLMLTNTGVIKLMDFGISRSQSADRTIMTSRDRVLGTEAYMSPEQLDYERARAELGPLCDIYSAGSTFYELFTLSRIYGHENDERSVSMATEMKKRGERPKQPILLRKGLSQEISVILMGCLESSQSDRYQSARSLQTDLVNFLSDRAILYRQPSRRRRVQLFYRRNRRMTNVVATFLLLILMTTTLYVIQIASEKDKAVAAEASSRQSLAHMYYRQSEDEVSRSNLPAAVCFLSASLESTRTPVATAKLATLLQTESWLLNKGYAPQGLISPQGKFIVTGSALGTVQLLNLDGTLKRELPRSARSITSVDGKGASGKTGNQSTFTQPRFLVDASGSHIADILPGKEDSVHIWNSNGTPLSLPSIQTNGESVGFSTDGKWFYVNTDHVKSKNTANGNTGIGTTNHSNYKIFSLTGGTPRSFHPDIKSSRAWPSNDTSLVDTSATEQLVVLDNGNYIAAEYCGGLGVYKYVQGSYQPVARYDLADFFQSRPDGLTQLESTIENSLSASTSDYTQLPCKLFADASSSRLVVASGGSFAVLDASTGARLYLELDPIHWITDTDFTSGKLLLCRSYPNSAGGYYGNGILSVYDLSTFKQLPLEASKLGLSFTHASFSPDGSRILATDKNDSIHIFDAITGSQVCQPVSVEGTIKEAYFWDNRHVIADLRYGTSEQTSFKTSFRRNLYEIRTPQSSILATTDKSVERILSARDGKVIYIATRDGAYGMDSRTGKKLFHAPSHTSSIDVLMDFDVTPDGSRMLLAYQDGEAQLNKGYVLVYNHDGSKLLADIPIDGYLPKSTKFSPDGKCFFIGCADLALKSWFQLWDCSSQTPKAITGRIVPTGVNTTSSNFVKTLWAPKVNSTNDAETPKTDPTILAAGNHSIYLYNSAGTRLTAVTPADTSYLYIKDMVVSLDGLYLAIGCGSLVVSSGEYREKVLVYRLSELLTGNTTTTSNDISNKVKTATLPKPVSQYELNSTPVKLTLSPDGTRLAAACLDGTIVIGDFPQIDKNMSILTNNGKINDLTFDKTSQFVIASIDTSGLHQSAAAKSVIANGKQNEAMSTERARTKSSAPTQSSLKISNSANNNNNNNNNNTTTTEKSSLSDLYDSTDGANLGAASDASLSSLFDSSDKTSTTISEGIDKGASVKESAGTGSVALGEANKGGTSKANSINKANSTGKAKDPKTGTTVTPVVGGASTAKLQINTYALAFSGRIRIWYSVDQQLVYESQVIKKVRPTLTVTPDNQVVAFIDNALLRHWIPEGDAPDWVPGLATRLSGYQLNERTSLQKSEYTITQIKERLPKTATASPWKTLVQTLLGN